MYTLYIDNFTLLFEMYPSLFKLKSIETDYLSRTDILKLSSKVVRHLLRLLEIK